MVVSGGTCHHCPHFALATVLVPAWALSTHAFYSRPPQDLMGQQDLGRKQGDVLGGQQGLNLGPP